VLRYFPSGVVIKVPFTPFHLGPALLIGMIFFPYVDLVAIFISSVIVDVEPAYFLYSTGRPVHGFLHSYMGGTLVAFLLSCALYPFRRTYCEILRIFGMKQETSFRKILLSSLVGVYSHIFLDSFMYPEMEPFYPMHGNPLLGVIKWTLIYDFCMWAFFVGTIVYAVRVLLRRSS